MLLGAHLYRLQTDNELLLSVSSAKRKKKRKICQSRREGEMPNHAQPLVTFGSFSLQLCWKTSRWVALLVGTERSWWWHHSQAWWCHLSEGGTQDLLVSQSSCKVLLDVGVHHGAEVEVLAVTEQVDDEHLGTWTREPNSRSCQVTTNKWPKVRSIQYTRCFKQSLLCDQVLLVAFPTLQWILLPPSPKIITQSMAGPAEYLISDRSTILEHEHKELKTHWAWGN